MQILLDTHALIWFLENNPLLSKKAKSIIEDPDNEIFVSIVSFYEMSIKLTIGKLTLPDSLEETITKTIKNNIQIHEINRHHVVQYQQIPLLSDHKDPFDRMIIATATHEHLDIISVDENFVNYKSFVNIIW
jgi:PIN domain nuclease of toxin-antitoxin system